MSIITIKIFNTIPVVISLSAIAISAAVVLDSEVAFSSSETRLDGGTVAAGNDVEDGDIVVGSEAT